MYAKLINNRLQTAPNKVQHNNNTIFNPPPDILTELGYYPVTYTDPPDPPDGQHYESGWTQTDTAIVQVWTLVDDPEIPDAEISAEEALNIIIGGDGIESSI